MNLLHIDCWQSNSGSSGTSLYRCLLSCCHTSRMRFLVVVVIGDMRYLLGREAKPLLGCSKYHIDARLLADASQGFWHVHYPRLRSCRWYSSNMRYLWESYARSMTSLGSPGVLTYWAQWWSGRPVGRKTLLGAMRLVSWAGLNSVRSVWPKDLSLMR